MTLGRRITGVAVLAALCVVAPMTAHAGLTGTRLPFHGFSDMEVDGATGHLLLTGGRAMAHVGSYLTVMDAAGTFLGKVDGTGGAAELAIDEASRVVYVARPDHHAIAVVNLDTLTVVDSFRTPSASPGPRSLALIGTRLWFGFGDWYENLGGIGDVNLTTRIVHTFIDQSVYPSYDPELVGSTASNLLVTAEEGSNPVQLRVFDVSSGKPVPVASRFDPGGQGFGLGEMRLNVTGTKLLLGIGGPSAVQRFALPSLTRLRSFPASYGLGALGGTAPGPIAAGELNRSGKIVATVMDGWTGTPISRTSYGRNLRFPAKGMAFSADLSTLYVITQAIFGRDRLHVVADPLKTDAALTIAASPSPAQIGNGVWLQGTLSYLDGSSAAGRSLTIFRHDPDGTDVPLDVMLGVDGNGHWSVTDQGLDVRGTYRYTVGVAGDATHEGATASTYLQVLGLATSLQLAADTSAAPDGGSVTLTAHLGAFADTANQDVQIWAVPAQGTRTEVAEGSFDGSGDFRATISDLRMNTSFVAMWGGDQIYEPAQSDPMAVGVRSAVTGTLDLASGSSGATSLYPYADDCSTSGYVGCPYVSVTIDPVPQQSPICFQVQEQAAGVWSDRAGWPYCGYAWQATTTLVMGTSDAGIIGVPLRVRAITDDTWRNLGSATSWLRFEITSDVATTATEPFSYHHPL